MKQGTARRIRIMDRGLMWLSRAFFLYLVVWAFVLYVQQEWMMHR